MTQSQPLSAQDFLPLEADDIHIWPLSLDLPEAELRRLEGVISAEETAFAKRFAFPSDRSRYVAAHGLLRLVLARYLDTIPAAVTFRRNADGKPRLAHPERLRFNLSHSGLLGLLAVSAKREVGVDVEEIRDIDNIEDLAKTCFSPAEQAALAAVPAEQRKRGVLRRLDAQGSLPQGAWRRTVAATRFIHRQSGTSRTSQAAPGRGSAQDIGIIRHSIPGTGAWLPRGLGGRWT